MRRRAFGAASAAAVAGVVGGIAVASSASADNNFPAAPAGSANLHATDTPVVAVMGLGGATYHLVEPASFRISEFSSVGDLEWFQWGPDVAIATGYLRGLWIENEESQYDNVTVTLFNVQNGFFTEFWITGPFEQPEYPDDFTHGYFSTHPEGGS
jgi:hypothetical protein